MSYQMKCWGPGEGRHICHQHPSQEGGEVTTWSGQHTMLEMEPERRGSQSQIWRDQDVGLRFEDALVNAVYQQEAAWTEKFYLMHLYGIRNWERETSFFPISIHTMWIGKLSLWSLRSPPSAQPIPGPGIGWMEPKSLCRIIAFVFILARTLDSRENPFIKLDSDLFSRFLALAPSAFSLCFCVHFPDQRVDSDWRNLQWTMEHNPFPFKTFWESLSRLKSNVS